jgi:hypothetical protein
VSNASLHNVKENKKKENSAMHTLPFIIWEGKMYLIMAESKGKKNFIKLIYHANPTLLFFTFPHSLTRSLADFVLMQQNSLIIN